ncbi:MAG TPA: hypothetical protein PKV91_04145 [Bacillota bacterium]|nr:hypothetical protein [Bacillota bacterium]HOA35372.1 hypothetical protein [Bacillota bacterium]HOJ84647.1 hypothetical protein [Bacillota bacterium]HOL14920.1 hypothetical protein [Bacillota bacterium]HPZ11528.1 hypothetical protein [Bacillota bacterium]
MNGPCRAKCANQRENRCQLDDERIRLNRVEFGDEWDPVQHCSGYRPRREQNLDKRRQR